MLFTQSWSFSIAVSGVKKVDASSALRESGGDYQRYFFHAWHGSPKTVKLLEFVERGLNFDRVTIN